MQSIEAEHAVYRRQSMQSGGGSMQSIGGRACSL